MRASFLIALGVSAIASVSASVLQARGYPTCANPCLTNIDLHGCGPTDYTCLCTNHAFLDESSQCIYDHCTDPKDLKEAVDTANAACKAAGVTITSTYTPTQSRTQSVSQTGSPTGSNTNTASITSAPTGSSTSSAAPTSTSGAAAPRFNAPGAYAMVGAAVLGALAF